MTYTWVPIVGSRYSGDIGYKMGLWWPNYSSPKYGCMNPPSNYQGGTVDLCNAICTSVVHDFREAVGASLYDEAKDDDTLVPIGCVPYIDAIVFFDAYYLAGFVSMDANGNIIRYEDEAYRDGRRKATIYRRQLGEYLKKQLVGEIFPQELPPVAPAVPFYTTKKVQPRSL